MVMPAEMPAEMPRVIFPSSQENPNSNDFCLRKKQAERILVTTRL